jgi:hypothetical protein
MESLPQELIDKFIGKTSHIPAYTSIPSLDVSGEGAKNTLSPPHSRQIPEARTDRLMLLSPQCTVVTITVFGSLPPELVAIFFLIEQGPEYPLSALPPVLRMRPLVELQLRAAESGVGTALAQCGGTSRKTSSIVSEAV